MACVMWVVWGAEARCRVWCGGACAEVARVHGCQQGRQLLALRRRRPQVEWLRARIGRIPVRLIFESSLELMEATQVLPDCTAQLLLPKERRAPARAHARHGRACIMC